MDGLIPLVYKSIKKNKIRRQYEFLSSGSAQTQSYNVSVSDFYSITHRHQHPTSGSELHVIKPSAGSNDYHNNKIVVDAIAEAKLHRRHMSVEDLSAAMASGDYPPRKKLVRFHSQRMFSCLSGA
uniref:Uncharacterized protein MANES_01G009800 n=1 Tax=Rhizophora mucronata TaxID=61149 RepID=A0A2P2QTH2_RHIMU